MTATIPIIRYSSLSIARPGCRRGRRNIGGKKTLARKLADIVRLIHLIGFAEEVLLEGI